MRPSFVESHVVEAVKDEVLPDDIPNFPGNALARRVMEWCPSMVVWSYEGPQDTLPFDNPSLTEPEGLEGLRLIQLTQHHGRSFEIRHPAFTQPWQDEYGHTYTSVNLKGNNFAEPGILESVTAAQRITAYGLQESFVMRRVLRASRLLRQNGVPTEYIMAMAEPKELPWPRVDSQTECTEKLPLVEYKRRLIEEHWKELPEEERTAEAFVELTDIFSDTAFFITMRAMDTSIRFGDVRTNYRSRERVFGLINESTAYGKEYPLDSNNPSDMLRYANEFVAPRLAQNLAAMHKLGLAHRYPHETNITALGSIIDLDSVYGAPLKLGDAPITAEDMARDVVELLWAIDPARYAPLLCRENQKMQDPYRTFLFGYFNEMKVAKENDSSMIDPFEVLTHAYKSLDGSGRGGGMSRSTPTGVMAKLEEVLVEMLTHEQEQAIAGFVDTWLNDQAAANDAAMIACLEENIPGYMRIIFDEYINEIASDRDFDVITAFYKAMGFLKKEIYDLMVFDSLSQMEKLFSEYLARLPQDVRLPAALPPEVYTMYLGRELVGALEDGRVWGPINALVTNALPKLHSKFEEHGQIKWMDRIFPDMYAYPTLRSAQNVFIMETEDVELTQIADYLESTDEELIIEAMTYSENFHDNNFVVTDDGSILTELISEGATDGLSQDVSDDEINRNLRYGVPPGQYILFVETKPDGTRRLRLHLKDEAVAQQLSGATKATVAAVLRASFNVPEQLFDDSMFERRIPLVWEVVERVPVDL